jgi:hypothetical protein
MKSNMIWAAAMAGALTFAAASPASALSMQECSAKYKSAKAAGTLGGQKWNDFRKSQCGSEASAAAKPAAAPQTSAKGAAAQGASSKATSAKATSAKATAPAASGPAVFPTAISPKYSSEKPGKARQHTCVDQYNANKASGANGGLKWIQKGGGYYSECNKRLKG